MRAPPEVPPDTPEASNEPRRATAGPGLADADAGTPFGSPNAPVLMAPALVGAGLGVDTIWNPDSLVTGRVGAISFLIIGSAESCGATTLGGSTVTIFTGSGFGAGIIVTVLRITGGTGFTLTCLTTGLFGAGNGGGGTSAGSIRVTSERLLFSTPVRRAGETISRKRTKAELAARPAAQRLQGILPAEIEFRNRGLSIWFMFPAPGGGKGSQ